MGLLSNIARGIRSLFHRDRIEREMDDELRGFVEASTADKLRRGMSAEQAARAARVEMGSSNAVKHNICSATWESGVEILWRDLKHCVRGFSRSPGFTLIAVLSLALGIGANTAIFTLIKQVFLRTSPCAIRSSSSRSASPLAGGFSAASTSAPATCSPTISRGNSKPIPAHSRASPPTPVLRHE
jgi:hypothetical protein